MVLPINILFLGGSRRVSVGEIFVETGKKYQRKVNIYSYELSNLEPIATIGTIIPGLKWKDENIYNHLKKVIREFGISIVIPFVDIATIICSNLQSEMQDVFFCTGDKEVSYAMYDKRISHEWFVKKGFLVPTLDMKVPLVAKLITGSGAKGMYYLKTDAELDFFLNNCQVEDYFIQQFVEGDEYSVDCYVDKHSNVISVVPRKRLEVINGEATKSVTVRDEQVIEKTRKIIAACNFRGPVTVQFIRQKNTDKLFLLEINPRLGSGVLTSIRSGANVCEFILNDYLDIQNKAVTNWTENLLMVRAFKEFYFDANNN